MVTKKAVRRTYAGRIIRVEEVDLVFEDGHERTYELVGFNTVTGVSALPITQKGVVLIKHYEAGLDHESYSLPTGGLNEGEIPEERMQLELQEEIGYKANKLTLMYRSHALPGYLSSVPGYIFLAENLVTSRLKGDEDYRIEIFDYSMDEVMSLIRNGEILDSRTLAAIFYYDKFLRH